MASRTAKITLRASVAALAATALAAPAPAWAACQFVAPLIVGCGIVGGNGANAAQRAVDAYEAFGVDGGQLARSNVKAILHQAACFTVQSGAMPWRILARGYLPVAEPAGWRRARMLQVEDSTGVKAIAFFDARYGRGDCEPARPPQP